MQLKIKRAGFYIFLILSLASLLVFAPWFFPYFCLKHHPVFSQTLNAAANTGSTNYMTGLSERIKRGDFHIDVVNNILSQRLKSSSEEDRLFSSECWVMNPENVSLPLSLAVELTDDPNERVAANATWVLGLIGDEGYTSLLRKLHRSNREKVVMAAEAVLGERKRRKARLPSSTSENKPQRSD